MGADRGPFVDDSISFSWGRDTIIDKAKERETNEIVNSAFLETAPLARCYSTARDRWRQRPAGFLFFPPFLVPLSFFLSFYVSGVCLFFLFYIPALLFSPHLHICCVEALLFSLTGFHWVLEVFIELYRVLLGFRRFHRVLMGFTGFYWVLPGFTGFYIVLLGFQQDGRPHCIFVAWRFICFPSISSSHINCGWLLGICSNLVSINDLSIIGPSSVFTVFTDISSTSPTGTPCSAVGKKGEKGK